MPRWYDWQPIKGQDFYLAGYDLADGKRTAFHMERNDWSIHFNLTKDLDIFTGDGGGGSGDFLMAALHRNGFANIPTSQSIDDGLKLTDAFILAAVRCAPPANKPTLEEILACQEHLEAELAQLPNIRVVVALGKIAFDAWWRMLESKGLGIRPRPQFGHGAMYGPAGSPMVIASYHPSRQNTNTGKLTRDMMESVFRKAARCASGSKHGRPQP